MPVLTNFTYGQPYRLRTVVDEAQRTQQASVLDSFGTLSSATTPQPLVQETFGHAAAIEIGNRSNLRATHTLSVRPRKPTHS